jgi:hypothetical protein
MTPRPSRPVRLRRWARAALTERLAYKAAALIFAIVLWAVLRLDVGVP